MAPEVSVIIPTYNRADVVQRAVRSVLAQTFSDFEVIVVDDGSTDATPAVVAALQDHRIRYIRGETRRGGGAARNTGIAAAGGRLIAFLDSDDEWLPQKLEKQTRLLQQRPTVAAVYGGYVTIDGQGQAIVRVPKFRGDILDEMLCGNVIGAIGAVLVRRNCLERVGAFDAALTSCQDWDLWIRLAQRYHIDFIPEVLVNCFTSGLDRISADPIAVAAGHLRIAEKYLVASDGVRRRPRARQFFVSGTRLIGLGYRAKSAESVRMGRRLVLAAYHDRPLGFGYLLNYGASYNGHAFRVLTGLGWRARTLFNVGERRQRQSRPRQPLRAEPVLTQTD